MTEGRALLTEREREALANDETGSYRYKTRTYLRSRLEKLHRDAELLAEHEPELFDQLQAAVCDDTDAGRTDDTATPRGDGRQLEELPADVFDAGDSLPGTVDHGDAVAAVTAARDYIRDHGGATKQDLVTNIMPTHSLGYDADAALEKIDAGERFRGAWWRRVVKPGLEALDEVDAPATGASVWSHIDDTGGE